MGAYFSLRGVAEWDQTISEMLPPSIWSTVSYSPLHRDQQMLLDRPSRVQFAYPSGIRQCGDLVLVSDTSQLSMLVGFDDSGRFFSAIVLRASEARPHNYSRTVEEVVVTAAKSTDGWKTTTAGASLTRSLTRSSSFLSTAKAPSGLTMDQFGESGEPPSQERAWQYLMLYLVKEGVLLYFADDIQSCKQMVRSIAARSHGDAQDSPAGKARASQVTFVEHHVGIAPPIVGRILADLIESELRREFAVKCAMEEQINYTNCAVFCVRVMMASQLSVRGYDIKAVCEAVPAHLGSVVGEVAGEGWEQLWRRVRA